MPTRTQPRAARTSRYLWVINRAHVWRVACGLLLTRPPVMKVPVVKRDTENVGRNEAKLGGAQADDTDQNAVDGGHYPSRPQLASYHHRREDGQHTRNVVEMKHAGIISAYLNRVGNAAYAVCAPLPAWPGSLSGST